jgi:branched-chain amino acid transport system substrate-binding protein
VRRGSNWHDGNVELLFLSVTGETPSNRYQPNQLGENMRTSRIQRSVAGIMAAGLIFAACGSDDATPAASDAPTEEAPAATEAPAEEAPAEEAPAEEAPAEEAPAEEAPAGEALALEGDVEVAAGTTLALGDCPDDWSATQGVDGDEIRIGQTLPQSGALAAFGAIGEGMEMYFDFINDTDPIEGKDLVLISKDDGYEAGRAVANV